MMIFTLTIHNNIHIELVQGHLDENILAFSIIICHNSLLET